VKFGLNESRIGAVIAEPLSARAATGMRSSSHARHGVLLVVALDAPVRVLSEGARIAQGTVVLAPADREHALLCEGPCVEMMFDPECLPRLAGHARSVGAASALDGRLATRIASAMHAHRTALTRPEVLVGFARECAGWLTEPGPASSRIDRRVAGMLETLRAAASEEPQALSCKGLSQAHLRALFARDVGVSMRTYRLWRRLLNGVAAFSRVDATGAAHAAGFADLAHFSRTCRRMLGNSPTELGRTLLT
jgi:AraC-like DNA-binding protein